MQNKIETFTELRPLLYSRAYQLLGNGADAEDMVQECFLRWQRTDSGEVRSPKAFLTTVITRLCLKHLQSARVQREHSFGASVPDLLLRDMAFDPADHAQLAESLSVALLVMLQSLSPVERAVFLLREVFDCDYSEIATITNKSEENCRQILKRARERVAGRQSRFHVSPQHHEAALEKFLEASMNGDWRELMALLSDDATLVCDGADLHRPATVALRGAEQIRECVRARFSDWFPTGALLQTMRFRGYPVTLAYRSGVPASAVVAGTDGNGRLKSLVVITCPVRLRTLLVQRDPA
ncbi:MAG TPA: sigma-70 family RNA polymerase sigma factor [Verrucomicrobia bacterium]|nr:sigma-70 family RNA polymerase sigma factor [Verrucomicrobiota bacterium]HOP96168.1 sigma-70 family RNA polymerase sigma factor [Verrucomicrobiota bacterium]